MQREIQLMKDTGRISAPGFPRLYFHMSDENFYYIVMEMLGKSLKDLRDETPGHNFGLKTATMIGI